MSLAWNRQRLSVKVFPVEQLYLSRRSVCLPLQVFLIMTYQFRLKCIMVINDNIHILLQSSPGNVWLIRSFREFFYSLGGGAACPPKMTPLTIIISAH